jgi:hypothetical protein
MQGLQDSVNYNRQRGINGALADISNNRNVKTYLNDSPRAAQVNTVVIDTNTNDHVYSLTIGSVLVSYTADATATKIEIAAGLAAAINAESLINGRLVAASDGVDTITLTARYAGEGFTITNAEAKMTLATVTANDTADAVGFGRAVMKAGADGSNRYAKAVSGLVAQVAVLTPAAVNLGVYAVTVTHDGQGYSAQFTADASATVQEIVEGLQTALAGLLPSAVVATENNTTLILTAAQAGDEFFVSSGSSAATATITIANTRSALTSLNLAFAGLTVYDRTRMIEQGATEAEYEGGSAMGVLDGSSLYALVESAVTDLNAGVYVRVAASGTNTAIGKLSPAAGTGLVKCEKLSWDRLSDALLIAMVNVNL